MSRIPKHIRVGSYSFRVRVNAKLIEAEERKADGSHIYGLSDLSSQIILVRPGMGAEATADTLLHELLHMCVAVGGGDHDEAEEDIIRRIAPNLLNALRQNPELVDYLTGDS